MRWVTRLVLSRRKTRASGVRSKNLSVAALCERKLTVLITTRPRPHTKNGKGEKRALPGPRKSSHACPEILRMAAVRHPSAAARVLLVAFRRRTFARGEGLIEGTGKLH
jgi:hypothetical protein